MMVMGEADAEYEILPDGGDEEDPDYREQTGTETEPDKAMVVNPFNRAAKLQIPDWARTAATGLSLGAGGALAAPAIGNAFARFGDALNTVGRVGMAAWKLGN